MALLLGIDPSSKTLAIVTAVREVPITKKVVLAKKYEPMAAFNAVMQFGKYMSEPHMRDLMKHPQKVAYLEAPVVARGGSWSTIAQSFTSGALQSALHGWGYEIVLVRPGQWKKEVIGNGAASKQEVAAHMEQRWPALHQAAKGDQDLIDAGAIYLWGVAEFARRSA